MRANRGDRQRFLREGQRASALNHPNIAGIYDVLEDKDEVLLVMEYIDGGTLRQRETFDWTNHRSHQCTVTPCDPNNWPLTSNSYPVPAKTGGNNGTCPATVKEPVPDGTYYFDCDCCAGCPPALGNPKSITIP